MADYAAKCLNLGLNFDEEFYQGNRSDTEQFSKASNTPEWKNLLLQSINYMVDPSIQKKNSIVPLVISTGFLPELEKNNAAFKDIRTKIDELKFFCYF